MSPKEAESVARTRMAKHDAARVAEHFEAAGIEVEPGMAHIAVAPAELPEGFTEEGEMERGALHQLLEAARKVPIVRTGEPGTPEWLQCMGCGATGSDDCEPGCWVSRLEAAIARAEREDG